MHQSGTLSKPLAAKMESKVEGEEEEEESLFEFVSEHVNKFFIDHIPVDSIKDLDTTYMYYFGTVAHILAIFLFIVFTYRNYESQVDQAFIAVSTSDGSDCETVSIAVSGEYLADYNGNWIGSPHFVNSKAIYALSFSNFEISSISQYQDMMTTFQHSFDGIGRISMHQNLAENLIFWMSFLQYYSVANPTATDFSEIGYGQLQSIELTGNPQNVFDLEYIKGSVSSVSGNCPLPSFSQFDQANGFLSSVYFNYTQFASDYTCAAAVNPKSFGYISNIDDNTYTLKLDVRSFAAAMAVNYGVLPIASMKVVNFAQRSFEFAGVYYNIGQYYDLRTPLMDTITCIMNATAVPEGSGAYERLCFYLVGETFALPVFNHYGVSAQEPQYCDCATGTGSSTNCQEFNLLSGLVFFKNKGSDLGLRDLSMDLSSFGLFTLLDMMTGFSDYRAFNRAAYNASFIAAATEYRPDPEALERAYGFCVVNGTQSCSMMLFNSFEATSYEVSNYKYQLFNGSCANSSSIPAYAWANITARPPVMLTQTYFECYDSAESSFINAVGIASGNVQILIPFVVFALLPFLYFLLVLVRQVPPKPEYTREEQDQALEIFSMLLLRLRDGKTRGIRPRGVLMGLTKEIISAAKEEGGYPDSDDEEDEDGTVRDDRDSDAKRRRSSSSNRPIRKLRNSSLNSTASSVIDQQQHHNNTHYNARRSNSNATPGFSRKSSQTGVSEGRYPVHSYGRVKMAVFTKQLAERNRQQSRMESTDGGSGDVKRLPSVSSFFNPFSRTFSSTAAAQDNPMHNTSPYAANKPIRTTVNTFNRSGAAPESKDNSSNNSTAVCISEEVPVEGATRARKRSSIIGYLFGGSETPGVERESELVAQGPAYVDLNIETVPHGVKVMNAPDEFFGAGMALNSKKPLSADDVDLLVEDLLRLFGEAVAARGHAEVAVAAANDAATSKEEGENAGAEGAEGDRNMRLESTASVSVPRDSFSFVQGKQLSARLAQVRLEELLRRDDKTVFLKLSNALCMQASVELNVEMRQVAQRMGDQIAYNIGGKLLTATHLDAIL